MTDIKEVQSHLLGILENFNEFCQANELRYYLLGGTLLGAVRHKGFIPWDDDIDIGMPRDDYEKLVQKFNNNLCQGRYEIEEYRLNKDFVYPFVKMYDTQTTVRLNFVTPFTRGVFIDIFPIDGTYQSVIAQRMHLISIKSTVSLILHKKKAYPFTSCKRIKLKRFMLRLVTVCFSSKRMHKSLNWLLARKSFDDSGYVGNLLGAWGEREIVPRYLFKYGRTKEFCGKHYSVPTYYHEYLKNIYGSYEKLPPADKQKASHMHKMKIDLLKPYK